jgi:hypothetical protein
LPAPEVVGLPDEAPLRLPLTDHSLLLA